MDIIKKLEKFLASSRENQKEAEDILDVLKKSDYLKENETLKENLKKENDLNKKLEKNIYSLEKKKTTLQSALFDQIFDEKKNILKVSQSKINLYFKKSEKENLNELQKIENLSKKKLAKLKKEVSQSVIDDKEKYYTEIEKYEIDFNKAVEKKRLEIQKQYSERLKGLSSEYGKLRDEAPDEETMRKRVKRNHLELKIGLGLLNKIGIILGDF